jgi:SAM-dependent methyltransferase
VAGSLRGRAARRRFADIEAADAFDARYGTETTQQHVLLGSYTDSPSVVHATSYWPSHVRVVEAMFDRAVQHPDLAWRVDPAARVFVDVGCGKGRALLLASELPFRHLHGVDFSAALLETAQRNVERWKHGAERDRISLHHADALAWELPGEPLVVYLFHPFDATVMTPFVDRLVASLEQRPRSCTVLYLNPKHDRCFEVTGRFEIERHPSEHEELGFTLLRWRG